MVYNKIRIKIFVCIFLPHIASLTQRVTRAKVKRPDGHGLFDSASEVEQECR